MDDRKVKGTMLIDQVKMIRGNKDRDWSPFLDGDDWDIINSRILPSMWYPLKIYQKCGWATYNVLADKNPELTRLRGKIRGKELFENVYHNLITNSEPMKALEKFTVIYGQLFNFSDISFEKTGEKHALIKHDYDPKDPAGEPYCHQLMGHFESLIEMAGGKNIEVGLVEKQWEGSPHNTFDIKWD